MRALFNIIRLFKFLWILENLSVNSYNWTKIRSNLCLLEKVEQKYWVLPMNKKKTWQYTCNWTLATKCWIQVQNRNLKGFLEKKGVTKLNLQLGTKIKWVKIETLNSIFDQQYSFQMLDQIYNIGALQQQPVKFETNWLHIFAMKEE